MKIADATPAYSRKAKNRSKQLGTGQSYIFWVQNIGDYNNRPRCHQDTPG